MKLSKKTNFSYGVTIVESTRYVAVQLMRTPYVRLSVLNGASSSYSMVICLRGSAVAKCRVYRLFPMMTSAFFASPALTENRHWSTAHLSFSNVPYSNVGFVSVKMSFVLVAGFASVYASWSCMRSSVSYTRGQIPADLCSLVPLLLTE